MLQNIDRARKEIKNRPETEQVTLDGSTSDVIVRALVEDVTDDFERAVDRLDADIVREKWVGFGVEVTIK